MSVLIKGMEMPKTCDDCFLPLRYCPYAMKPNGECPLLPVPPHGRLIDADALKVSLAFAEETAKWAVPALRAVLMVIDEMPTIIEAEREE